MRRYLDKEHLLRLTTAVYRVTSLFPEEELRDQIRESADKALADLLLCSENGSRYIKDIEGLMELFDLAEGKNWINPRNFLVLRREYDKVGHAMSNGHRMSNLSKNSAKTVENSLSAEAESNSAKADFPKNSQNNHRQEKILEVINGNGKTKIGELVQLFPGINRRTILRDLEKLCRAGVAVRNGNGRGVYYTTNGQKCDTPLEIS